MIPELQQLGLTLYEIKAYRTLLEFGKLDAKTVARESGVPQTAVYPALKQLQEKGLIQQFQGEIKWYEPLAPALTLSTFIERKKQELSDLKEKMIQQTESVFHSRQIFKKQEVLQLTQGRDTSAAIYHDALKKVKNSYYSMGWHFTHVGDKYTFLQEFRKALQRKVDIRIIMTGNYNKNWKVISAYQQAGLELRYLPLENFSFFIADGTECKITLKRKDLGERTNILILDTSFAKAMNGYFLERWKQAEKVVLEK